MRPAARVLCLSLLLLSPVLTAQLSWRQLDLPDARQGAALAYDAPRGVVLMVGGVTDDPSPLADTWQWDGTRWTQLFPATAPGARGYHSMVYDQAHGEIVLFGGWNGGGFLSDTWVWRNGQWTRLFPATSPGARDHAQLAYDSQRGRVVLYGGYANGNYADTWEWDGNNWQQQLGTQPGGRHGHGLVYLGGGRTLLFGGYSNTALRDTWLWDGTSWVQQAPATSPPARWHPCLGFDATRGRAVLFGGWSGSASLNDTWQWTGSNWSAGPTQGAPARHLGSATWDGARQQIVVFGGRVNTNNALSDTWTFDGTAWQQPVAPVPMYRSAHRMVFDTGRNRVVLFGGAVGWNNAYTQLADTWEFDGAGWTGPAAGPGPSARYYHGLAYDAARQVSVLYGGYNAALGNLGDQWQWDGATATWTAVTPPTTPGVRNGHSFVALPNSDILLSGGHNGSAYVADTWLWNGTTWSQLSGTGPAARGYGAAAYDPTLDRVVLFGGWNGSGNYGDTWQWTRAQGWNQLFPATAPVARSSAQLAFDSDEGALVLYGGQSAGPAAQNDIWLLQGSTWTHCVQRAPLAARWNHAMAYDPVGHRLLSFGGDPGRHGDLWAGLNPTPATARPFGTGCASCPPGPVPTLTARTLPWRGDTLLLEIGNLSVGGFATPFLWLGFSAGNWNGIPLPLAMPQFPGCSMWSGWNELFTPGRSGTTATLGVPIPFDYLLVGQRIYFQGMVADVCNFAPRIGASNALDLMIGCNH